MVLNESQYPIVRKRLVNVFLVVLTMAVLLSLLSYFWLPVYAKSKLESVLSDVVQRSVTVESIDINLYSLELTINGFQISEKPSVVDVNKVFFSFEKLHVDLSVDSIRHRTPIINAVLLQDPVISLVRETDELFNITDLIEKFVEEPDADDSKVLFSVSNIVIQGGHFEFVDQFKQTHQKISKINLDIPFVANFENTQTVWVEPRFSALVNGVPLLLDGKVRPFANKREATLVLELAEIDLTDIDEYLPIPTGISLRSGYFDSKLHLTFTQLMEQPSAIVLSGYAELSQLALINKAVEEPYHATLEKVNIELTEVDLTGVKPSHLALTLGNFSLTRKNDSAPIISLPELTINKVVADVAQKQIIFSEIILDRFSASLHQGKDGVIDLTRFFTSSSHIIPLPVPGYKPSKHTRSDASLVVDEPSVSIVSAEETLVKEKSWDASIEKFELNAAALRFKDLTLTDAAPIVVDPINLTVQNIDLIGSDPVDFVLQAVVNHYGGIETKGSLAWNPLVVDLDFDLNKIEVLSLQGFLGDQFNAILTSGAISFQGELKADGKPLQISVSNAQGQLVDFNLVDKEQGADLLHWKELNINEVNFVSEPLDVEVASVELKDFFVHVKITPQGNFNLNNIVKPSEQVAPAEPPPLTMAENQENKLLPLHVGEFILQHGGIYFSDQSISPNYQVNLTGLSGKIGPLHQDEVVKVDLHGLIDKSAPMEIKGQVDLFSDNLLLDVMARIEGVDMPTFSPYSDKHIGYNIDTGKLSLDVDYHFEDGVLKAKNNIFLDQFTFGEKTDNPDALSLPLDLVVSLFKNKTGDIDIHLPIEGSLIDPRFSLGDVVFDAFINLIMRAITAPFALLNLALDDGEEVSRISFASGLAEINLEAAQRLQMLSQVLNDRPMLSLEITGYADPMMESEGLKLVILERKVKTLKLAEDVESGKASVLLDDVILDLEDYEKYLTIAYDQALFEKPRNIIGLTKNLSVLEMEQLMLANVEVNVDDRHELAEQRANAARDWLIKQGKILGDRIFISKVQPDAEETEIHDSHVEFSLK